jgi:hypothetical protein
VLVGLAGCVAPPPIEQLPAYSQAIGIAAADSPQHPLFYLEGQPGTVAHDDLVPYARIVGLRNGGDSPTLSASRLAMRLIRVMPDAFGYAEGAPEVVSVVSAPVGFGVTTGAPVTATRVVLTAYRRAPSRMPFELHPASDVVVGLRDKEAAGDLMHGDTVTSIGGWSLVDGVTFDQSPWARQRLALRPGDSVPVTWVRSGVGAMRGNIRMLDGVGDLRRSRGETVLVSDQVVRVYRDDLGQPFWGYFNPAGPYGS